MSRRNVQGHTLQVRGEYSGEKTGNTCERNVQKMDFTSKRKFQGTDARWSTLMDITSHCLLSSSQEPSKCLLFSKVITSIILT